MQSLAGCQQRPLPPWLQSMSSAVTEHHLLWGNLLTTPPVPSFLFWGGTWVLWRVPLCENSRLIDVDFLRPAHLLPQRKFKTFFTISCRLGFGRLAHPTPISSNSALSSAPATLLGFQHFFISIGTPTYLSCSCWPHFWGLYTLDKNPGGNSCLRLQKSTWMAVLEQHVWNPTPFSSPYFALCSCQERKAFLYLHGS